MRVANGLEMLEISAMMMGKVEAVEKAGLSLEQVRRIVITHQDLDHVGSLPSLLEAAEGKIECRRPTARPGPPVHARPADCHSIPEGTRPLRH